ncbi:hypothetical protein KKC91_03530 [bacterium]|nr:hypothetical protein [bacterium]
MSKIRNGKSYTYIFLICFIFTLLYVNSLYAWSGLGPSIEKQYEDADVIFKGEVIKINFNLWDKISGKKEPRIEVVFDVCYYWKGINSNRVVLHTVFNKFTGRGFYFEKDKKYIVFAHKKDNKLDVNVYNVFLNTNEEVARLLGEPLGKFE